MIKLSVNSPTGGPLAMVNDLLAPRLSHILSEIKETNKLLAGLGLGLGGGGSEPSNIEAIVARFPISLSDLVYSMYATRDSGLVDIFQNRQSLAILAGNTGVLAYNNPNPSKVICFMEPLRILASAYSPLIITSLTIDDVPHMVVTPTNYDFTLEYMKYLVFNRNITVTVTNASLANTTITLDGSLAAVDATLYEDTWLGIMRGSYESLKRIAPER